MLDKKVLRRIENKEYKDIGKETSNYLKYYSENIKFKYLIDSEIIYFSIIFNDDFISMNSLMCLRSMFYINGHRLNN